MRSRCRFLSGARTKIAAWIKGAEKPISTLEHEIMNPQTILTLLDILGSLTQMAAGIHAERQTGASGYSVAENVIAQSIAGLSAVFAQHVATSAQAANPAPTPAQVAAPEPAPAPTPAA